VYTTERLLFFLALISGYDNVCRGKTKHNTGFCLRTELGQDLRKSPRGFTLEKNQIIIKRNRKATSDVFSSADVFIISACTL
jgi:hypothetical protein